MEQVRGAGFEVGAALVTVSGGMIQDRPCDPQVLHFQAPLTHWPSPPVLRTVVHETASPGRCRGAVVGSERFPG